jgi:hypothetical protein
VTYVIPYLVAAQLVWGPIAPGAPSYEPGQTWGRHDDCSRAKCVAPCTVTAVRDPGPGRQFLVTLTCKRSKS